MTARQRDAIQEIVRYVNKARAVMGLQLLVDLPKGLKEDSGSCPIARALNEFVTVDCDTIDFGNYELAHDIALWWGTNSAEGLVTTPDVMVNFIDEFDSGSIPEYDIDPDPEDEDDDEEDPDEPDIDF